MDPLRIAIVEDEESNQKILQDYLERLSKEKGILFKIAVFNNGVAFLNNYQAEYDLVFMDIQMPFENGIEVSKALREKDKYVAIIFVTNFVDYAVNGYEVNALDFIIKPVNYSTFSMRFTRAIGRVKNREGRRVCLYLPDGPKWIDSREIYYIDIQNRMLHYHTPEGVYSVRGTLKDVQEQLADWNFVKCNQCYLVNLKFVSEIKKNFVVVAGTELEISRRNRNAFLAAVTDYLGS